MKSVLTVLLLLSAGSATGCAKVDFDQRALGSPRAAALASAASADPAAERAELVAHLRDRYGLDVGRPVSVWSCCGIAWGRYPDRDLVNIGAGFDRILELSGDEGTGDQIAKRTLRLRDELRRAVQARR